MRWTIQKCPSQPSRYLILPNLLSLPLMGLDMVLGIQWLEKLGTVTCDWKRLTMEFSWERQVRRLQGVGGQAI